MDYGELKVVEMGTTILKINNNFNVTITLYRFRANVNMDMCIPAT